jgi:hypothetical protein
MPHKKSHKKSAGRRKTVKKGGYYGFNGQVGTGAPLWATGAETKAPAYAGGKRRKSRKVTRRRRHRGGGSWGAVSASYQGTGSRGIADYVPVSTKTGDGGPALGAFNVKPT